VAPKGCTDVAEAPTQQVHRLSYQLVDMVVMKETIAPIVNVATAPTPTKKVKAIATTDTAQDAVTTVVTPKVQMVPGATQLVATVATPTIAERTASVAMAAHTQAPKHAVDTARTTAFTDVV
jgi:hypothetical protein